ncbi:UxaA family hydrolase [Pontiella agarivorans]|uniref:Altronate dehydratase family protein n=1 Tax=Pontiella agarivorans TaxID=3038953 RepID=A0ABU5N263_9BACT|nr:altronate dehydratase family protein [Pontiella agarivorans]MDZ8120516.1 altronate dehydratase family protein [Pontiella agarivorans]
MKTLKINERDNVAVVISDDSDKIPRGHKTALVPIEKGEAVIKYGFPIGYATETIEAGDWVHDHNVKTGLSGVQEYPYEPDFRLPGRIADGKTFMGYPRANGDVGIRNELWIVPTVGCVNGLAEKAAARLCAEGLPDNVDDVVVLAHPYGCSQLGDDHEASRTILSALVKHPNAGGVLVVGLGCENNTMKEFRELVGEVDGDRVKFLVTQAVEDELEACGRLLHELCETAAKDRRGPVPVSKLRIGLKCGGSDAFSGLTANALVGAVSDRLIARGGSAVLTEIPEAFGAETILFNRCVSKAVFDEAVNVVNDFKEYFLSHGEPVGENPSPGNKAGGITTLEDKSLGCVQKGGTAPLNDVLRYGARVRKNGLTLLEGPGNDIVAVTALAAAGCHMVLFTTGRGTPLGGPVPVVKIASNSALAERKKNWIDFNAGVLMEGRTMDGLGDAFFDDLVDVASGRKTRSEENGYRDFAIWKQGVTL